MIRFVQIDKLSERKSVCKNCGKGSFTDYILPQDSWIKIVPKKLQKEYICWNCYCKFRKEKGFKAIKYKEVDISGSKKCVLKTTNKEVIFCKYIPKITGKFKDNFEKLKAR